MKGQRKVRWTLAMAAVAVTLGESMSSTAAANEQCAELRSAYQDLKARHASLRQDRARHTGLFIPVPRSAMGEQLDCKTVGTLYADLAKSFTNLSVDVVQSRDAAQAKVEQATKDTFAQGDAFRKTFKDEAAKQMKAVEAFLGADSATDAQARLDEALSHLKTLQSLIKGFLGPLPAEFENPHTNIPLPPIGSKRARGANWK